MNFIGTSNKQKNKQQKKEQKKDMGLIMIVACMVLLILGGIYIDTFHGDAKVQAYFTRMGQSETTRSLGTSQYEKLTLETSINHQVISFGNAFVIVTKDGVKYYSEIGNQKWSDTYNMVSPFLISEGGYILVGDTSGNLMRLYNQNGFIHEIQMKGTIMQFALNENGYISVITKESTHYGVYIYNQKGTLLKERVEETAGIYPLCTDISDDNKSFAISYLDSSDIIPITRILLFYVGAEDSIEHTDSMYAAALDEKDEIVTKIAFMDNGNLVAVSDKTIYSIASSGAEQWSLDMNNELLHACLDNKSMIVVSLGNIVTGDGIWEKNTVVWINLKGRIDAEFSSPENIEYLKAVSNGVVIGYKNHYYGITHEGRGNWEYKGNSDVYDIVPMNTLRKCLVITNNEAILMEMERVGSGVLEPIVTDNVYDAVEEEVVGGNEQEGILEGFLDQLEDGILLPKEEEVEDDLEEDMI